MYEVRPARISDASRLAQIARAAYAPYVPLIGREPPPMLQDFPADIAAGRCWVAGDPPVGYVVAYPREHDWMLENVAVAPEAQGSGLGRILVRYAEVMAKAAGARAVVLYTNTKMARNREIYPSLGYAETGVFKESGLERVYFRKELS